MQAKHLTSEQIQDQIKSKLHFNSGIDVETSKQGDLEKVYKVSY